MPGGDRTGPLGMGPMSGRAAGYCAGFGMPGYMNPIPGRRLWMGFGRGGGGRGWRNRFYATGLPGWISSGWYSAPYPWYSAPDQKPTPDLEKQALKNQADFLQSELEQIKKRLSELETGESAK